ncbi:M23 family metallopeptidase [Corynebacterium sp.]|uniref:M23 family metallopeptidase n=1 Tax=Corynebacterium sp. TaxID=1720 RepID=UPI0026DBD413|nr:M23 family metallopeptidase [Corynebacterium sp.]MDO5032685.1 M23 family metallopeptidase [Corynebacterium sp.]
MKRTPSARKRIALAAAAVSASLVATLGAPAFAAEPAASVDVSDGSSEPTVTTGSNSELIDAFFGLATSAAGVLNGAAAPEFKNNNGAMTIVLDPSTIPGLADAFKPQGDHSGLTPVRSTDAEGNTVVFPTSGTFTSGFGPRWGSFHNGIDVANPIGTPIYSVMDGEVIEAGPAQGFGHWIRVQHVDGSVAVYGHMPGDQLMVNVGDKVRAGEQISVIGNEGYSTGPHLHFEIHPGGGNAVDPVQWFAERGISI